MEGRTKEKGERRRDEGWERVDGKNWGSDRGKDGEGRMGRRKGAPSFICQ